MKTPIYLPLQSDGVNVKIQLTALSSYIETGGSAVDSYRLQYKLDGQSTWTDVQGQDGQYTLNLLATISGLVVGNTYNFRAQAHNIQGWGMYSPVLTEISSAIPDAPLPISTQIVNQDIRIGWDQPNN